MVRFSVGDLVRFNADIRMGRRDKIYQVLKVSDIYDSLLLRNRSTGIIIHWVSFSHVSKISFYQPELTAEGV